MFCRSRPLIIGTCAPIKTEEKLNSKEYLSFFSLVVNTKCKFLKEKWFFSYIVIVYILVTIFKTLFLRIVVQLFWIGFYRCCYPNVILEKLLCINCLTKPTKRLFISDISTFFCCIHSGIFRKSKQTRKCRVTDTNSRSYRDPINTEKSIRERFVLNILSPRI